MSNFTEALSSHVGPASFASAYKSNRAVCRSDAEIHYQCLFLILLVTWTADEQIWKPH